MKTSPVADFHRFFSGSVSRTTAGFSKTKLVLLLCVLGMVGLIGVLLARTQSQQARITQLESTVLQIEPLKEQAAAAEQLRAENEELKRFREEHRELVKLRGEVSKLRSDAEAKQALETELRTLKGQIAQLQARATEAVRQQQNMTAQLKDTLEQQKTTQLAQACIANLQLIDAAIAAWAQDNQKQPTDVPTDVELFGPNAYIDAKPTCPASGTYTLGSVSQKTTCTVAGHQH